MSQTGAKPIHVRPTEARGLLVFDGHESDGPVINKGDRHE
ncbi:hypothetical protein EDC90_10714 [Martelella mediterranea]|uniref:Uncharacterized protein n=1 Tax=Martelella mediterranea TaxID=293089 RepID=A0A4R3NIJ0_9HYPH|nr:hypothetical protein EDC90_10714 [Martelella mediterranea]